MSNRIEIVGAGPAGLVAATNLAKAGCNITVYEEKLEVGHRFHGDFQGLENWSSEEDVTTILERLGIYNKLYLNYICQPYNKLIVFDSNLKETVFHSERPFFYLVQRGSRAGCLDYGLMKMAEGVKVFLDTHYFYKG